MGSVGITQIYILFSHPFLLSNTLLPNVTLIFPYICLKAIKQGITGDEWFPFYVIGSEEKKKDELQRNKAQKQAYYLTSLHSVQVRIIYLFLPICNLTESKHVRTTGPPHLVQYGNAEDFFSIYCFPEPEVFWRNKRDFYHCNLHI